LEIERLRYGLHQERLGEARHADEQHVSAREERRHEIVDDRALAYDAAANLFNEGRMRAGELVEQCNVA
jgi:hypothetical protein